MRWLRVGMRLDSIFKNWFPILTHLRKWHQWFSVEFLSFSKYSPISWKICTLIIWFYINFFSCIIVKGVLFCLWEFGLLCFFLLCLLVKVNLIWLGFYLTPKMREGIKEEYILFSQFQTHRKSSSGFLIVVLMLSIISEACSKYFSFLLAYIHYTGGEDSLRQFQIALNCTLVRSPPLSLSPQPSPLPHLKQ
jgi:hypothetical protein